MEDIKELTPEEIADMDVSEAAALLLERNNALIAAEKRNKEISSGAEKAATELNQLKKAQAEKEEAPKTVAEQVQIELENLKVQEKWNAILNQIPESSREAFETQFKELQGDNRLTPTNIEKLTKATLANMSDDDSEELKAVAIGGNSGGGKSVSGAAKFAEEQKAEAMKIY